MIVTASTPAPRIPNPKGLGVLADAPAASATARPNGPKEKISRTDRAKGGDGGNTIAHLEEELAD